MTMTVNKKEFANIFTGIWKDTGNNSVVSDSFNVARLAQFGTGELQYIMGGGGRNIIGEDGKMKTVYSAPKTFPDVSFLLSGISFPLWGVQYFEIARSQDLLQYRAIGGEFLGQQKGGHWGVRIDVILSGSSQDIALNIIKGLHLWSRAETTYADWESVNEGEDTVATTKTEEGVAKSETTFTHQSGYTYESSYNRSASAIVTNVFKRFNKALHYMWSGTGAATTGSKSPYISNYPGPFTVRGTQPVSRTVVNIEPVIDNKGAMEQNAIDVNVKHRGGRRMSLVAPDDYSWARQTWHRTFTVFTRDEILFDMYIETLGYRRSIRNGSKVIEANILLRHFDPPSTIDSTLVKFYRDPRGGHNDADPDTDGNIGIIREVITRDKIKSSNASPNNVKNKIYNKLSSQPWKVEIGINVLHRTIMSVFRYGIRNGYQYIRNRKILNREYDSNIYRRIMLSAGEYKEIVNIGDV